MKENKRYQQTAIELKKNLKEIKNLQLFNQNILKSIQSGVITVDCDERITLVNPSAKQILGDSLEKGSMISDSGLRIADFSSGNPESYNKFKKDIGEINITLKDQTRLVLEIGISDIIDHKGITTGKVIVFTDHTEKNELELQLARAARLSELGEMAAGIAHEIKNPLYSIKGTAEIISEDFKECDKKYNISKIMINEIDRLNDLVNNFLMFARPKDPTIIEVDLDDLIRKTLEMVMFKFDKVDKIVEFIKDGNIPLCHADPEQIKQVLINIIFNAFEVVGDDNGEIKIYIKENQCNVIIDIVDNGDGISEDNMEKIFTPFFTTKDNGAGLGLSISQKLIEANHGKIQVSNNRNGGCCFSIYIPIVK